MSTCGTATESCAVACPALEQKPCQRVLGGQPVRGFCTHLRIRSASWRLTSTSLLACRCLSRTVPACGQHGTSRKAAQAKSWQANLSTHIPCITEYLNIGLSSCYCKTRTCALVVPSPRCAAEADSDRYCPYWSPVLLSRDSLLTPHTPHNPKTHTGCWQPPPEPDAPPASAAAVEGPAPATRLLRMPGDSSSAPNWTIFMRFAGLSSIPTGTHDRHKTSKVSVRRDAPGAAC